MNRLQHETSPYLLQHAANPVDWYPWGQEALDKASAENKPILVSIGYSTCHWCHVMERESFENEDVAAYMNAHFVCIKVDREERPDVDQLYMEACQAVSGGGGWPLNAFLLPDARPFYAGTYFPPRSAHNRPGWIDLLDRISNVWREDRSALEQQAEQITKGILESNTLFINTTTESADLYSQSAIKGMIGQLKQRYDLQRGGFGGAPKFPMSQSLELLLDYGLLYEDEPSLQMVEHAVQSMINGGIYDQLRGGFSRYTVDGNWRVPHFEKMLYDNALLLRLLGKLQISRPKDSYLKTIEETVGWLKAEMLTPEGAFYAALDADSEGVEGKFYIWDYAELAQRSTADELGILTDYFGVTESGNWEEEHTNIFYRSLPLPSDKHLDWQQLQQKLLKIRAKRIRPGRDEKVILQWNALMISGLCYAYRATGDNNIRELALNAHSALEKLLYKDGNWHRNTKDGRLGKSAFLDDLTALNTARMDLYDITQKLSYIGETEKNISYILQHFGGAPGGLYHLVPPAETELPVQSLDLYDNALPSGNGQLLQLLRRLSAYTGKPEYRLLAEEKVKALGANVLKYPSSFANLGRLLLLLGYATRELVVSGTEAMTSVEAMLKTYRPDLTIVVVTTKQTEYPIMANRYSEKSLQLYLCENQSCRLPVSSLSELEL